MLSSLRLSKLTFIPGVLALLIPLKVQAKALSSMDSFLPDSLSLTTGPLTMGQSNTQTTVEAGDDFPPTAEFSQPLFFGPAGIHLSSSGIWFISDEMSIKVAATGQWGTYSLKVADVVLKETLVDVFAGAFFQYALSPQFTIEAGLGYHGIDGVFFRYVNQRTGADTLDLDIHGISTQVGFSGNRGALSYGLRAGQSFAPHPTATGLGLSVEYELPSFLSPKWSFHAGADYGLSLRHLTAPTHRTDVKVDGLTQALSFTLRVSVDPGALLNDLAPDVGSTPEPIKEESTYDEEGGLEL